MTVRIHVEPYAGLRLLAFTAAFPAPLAELDEPHVTSCLAPDCAAPVSADEGVKTAVRDLLRGHGYKPAGRGKPASEYLARAAGTGALGSINAAVDVCNAASLHSGLPISVVDLDRVAAPLVVRVGRPSERYVFNASGHEIALAGLLSLCDADGPCANAVRDSQRTKTHAGTTQALYLLWTPETLREHADRTALWAHDLARSSGAAVGEAEVVDVIARP